MVAPLSQAPCFAAFSGQEVEIQKKKKESCFIPDLCRPSFYSLSGSALGIAYYLCLPVCVFVCARVCLSVRPSDLSTLLPVLESLSAWLTL